MTDLPKRYLLLIAGLVWVFAGVMVVATGLPVLLARLSVASICCALAVFAVFYALVFSRLVKKHSARILDAPGREMPFWKFFDPPSYVIMAIMMSGGIALRKLRLIPDQILGPFYSGLGFALFLCGLIFIALFRKNAPKPDVSLSE